MWIWIDGCMWMEELVCDGVLLVMLVGLMVYNYLVYGLILLIGLDVLVLIVIVLFCLCWWWGVLVCKFLIVIFEVINFEKWLVMVDVDSCLVCNVVMVEIKLELVVGYCILFDSGYGLEECLICE